MALDVLAGLADFFVLAGINIRGGPYVVDFFAAGTDSIVQLSLSL